MISTGGDSKSKRLLKYSFLGLFLLTVGAGVWLWTSYSPKLAVLKKKDPEIFAQIIKETGRLHFIEAGRLLVELDNMTLNQAYWNRYRNWKEKWSNNPEFQQESLNGRLTRWKSAQASREKLYDEKIDRVRRKDDGSLSVNWNNMGPWQKGLVLRENCLRFFGGEAVSPQVGSPALIRSNFCENAIPLGHDNATVAKALKNLQRDMDYFNFSRMLDELGIPPEKFFSHKGKLEKMTGSLGGA